MEPKIPINNLFLKVLGALFMQSCKTHEMFSPSVVNIILLDHCLFKNGGKLSDNLITVDQSTSSQSALLRTNIV